MVTGNYADDDWARGPKCTAMPQITVHRGHPDLPPIVRVEICLGPESATPSGSTVVAWSAMRIWRMVAIPIRGPVAGYGRDFRLRGARSWASVLIGRPVGWTSVTTLGRTTRCCYGGCRRGGVG